MTCCISLPSVHSPPNLYQVVRTDLKELVEYPLEGAPYGYTPFCDSRKEMDGFRWVQAHIRVRTHTDTQTYTLHSTLPMFSATNL